MESGRVSARRVLAGLALVVAGACTLEYAPPGSAPGRAYSNLATTLVLTEMRAYYRDFSARDWPAFSDHFWDSATITTVWQPEGEDSLRVWTTTVPAFVAAAPSGPGSREIFEESMLDARITVAEDLAQAWVTYEARFGDPGAVQEWRGIDAFTLLRHGGRWRITALAFAPTGDTP